VQKAKTRLGVIQYGIQGLVEFMSQRRGQLAQGCHPHDVRQFIPMLLFLPFGALPQSDVPVAGPDADVLPGSVAHRLTDMFNPADCAIGPLHAELAFPDSRLFQSITIMPIP
jgi:hypothetical protein